MTFRARFSIEQNNYFYNFLVIASSRFEKYGQSVEGRTSHQSLCCRTWGRLLIDNFMLGKLFFVYTQNFHYPKTTKHLRLARSPSRVLIGLTFRERLAKFFSHNRPALFSFSAKIMRLSEGRKAVKTKKNVYAAERESTFSCSSEWIGKVDHSGWLITWWLHTTKKAFPETRKLISFLAHLKNLHFRLNAESENKISIVQCAFACVKCQKCFSCWFLSDFSLLYSTNKNMLSKRICFHLFKKKCLGNDFAYLAWKREKDVFNGGGTRMIESGYWG